MGVPPLLETHGNEFNGDTASCEGVVAPGAELAVAPHGADAVQLLGDPPAGGVLVAA